MGKLFRLLSSSHNELRRKINTLELEKKCIEERIKSKLFEKIMNKLDESDNLKKVRIENKRLRKKIKNLKLMKK